MSLEKQSVLWALRVFSFTAVESVGSRGPMVPQYWPKLPPGWLATVSSRAVDQQKGLQPRGEAEP